MKFPWTRNSSIANCLVETHRKFEELIPALIVDYELNRVQHPFAVASVPDKMVSHGMVYLSVLRPREITKQGA